METMERTNKMLFIGFCIISFLLGIGTGVKVSKYIKDKPTAKVYTDSYISDAQVSDSINRYIDKGYQIELIRVDSMVLGELIRKDIRYLPYVEIK